MKYFFKDNPEVVGVMGAMCILLFVLALNVGWQRRPAPEISLRDAPPLAPGETTFTERAVKNYVRGVIARIDEGAMKGHEIVSRELYSKLAAAAKSCTPEHTLQALVLLGASDALLLEVEDWNKDPRIPPEYRIVYVPVDSNGALGFLVRR